MLNLFCSRAWARGGAFVCLLTVALPLRAQEATQHRVLALYATTPGAAGALAFETTYQKILGDALGSQLDFHSEYIDLARFSEPTYADALVAFLRYKYQHLPPEVVLATTEPSRRFAEQYRSQIFPDAPIVFIDRVAAPHREPNTTGVAAPLNLAGSVDLALTLQPDTERVFVISGVSAFDTQYERLAREQLARFKDRVPIVFLSDLTWAELLQRAANLPPRSVIYFLTFGEDAAGARFVTLDARNRLLEVANAPMYAWNQVAMDHGVVGGHFFTNEIVAARSAEVALRIMRGERADDIPVAAVDSNLTQLDWRQLRRWRIAESRVPAGAAIMFREPTLWDRYKAYISGAVVLTFLQTALIAGLLVQRTRRRRAETEMREHQVLLEASNRQISELFGRVIAAQETERSRIARDLHDDVSQRIAALSLSMSGLKRKLSSTPYDTNAIADLNSMQRSAVELADQIRHVSHDLHPSVLQHAGLVPALLAFCHEFGALHALAVGFNAPSDADPIEGDVALCLYRITQEALRNVAKHAAARNVTVSVSRVGDAVQLSVADDGQGFDVAGMRGRATGLGLVSIDERVRLLGGQVTIDARPGGGTRLSVTIPHRAS